MPPKKRARVSQAASPAATDQHKTPTPAAQSPSKTDEDILNDPWTDEEAIGLYKAIIKWKPTGIHKHFRMLQIRQYLLDNRYIHPKATHTTIAGLWRKLATLYDLEALDEREDARQLSSDIASSASNPDDDSDEADDDLYSLAENKIHKQPFTLPADDEYIEELAWKRRFPGEKEKRDGSESPAVLPEVNLAREPPVGFVRSLARAALEPSGEEEEEQEDKKEPTDSPEPQEEEKRPRGRPKGSTSAKAGAQTPAAAAAAAERRRSTRQAAEPEEEEDEDEESDSSEDEEEDGNEEESSEEEEDASEETTPAPRSKRSGKTKPAPKAAAAGTGTSRRRGRPKKTKK